MPIDQSKNHLLLSKIDFIEKLSFKTIFRLYPRLSFETQTRPNSLSCNPCEKWKNSLSLSLSLKFSSHRNPNQFTFSTGKGPKRSTIGDWISLMRVATHCNDLHHQRWSSGTTDYRSRRLEVPLSRSRGFWLLKENSYIARSISFRISSSRNANSPALIL